MRISYPSGVGGGEELVTGPAAAPGAAGASPVRPPLFLLNTGSPVSRQVLLCVRVPVFLRVKIWKDFLGISFFAVSSQLLVAGKRSRPDSGLERGWRVS